MNMNSSGRTLFKSTLLDIFSYRAYFIPHIFNNFISVFNSSTEYWKWIDVMGCNTSVPNPIIPLCCDWKRDPTRNSGKVSRSGWQRRIHLYCINFVAAAQYLYGHLLSYVLILTMPECNHRLALEGIRERMGTDYTASLNPDPFSVLCILWQSNDWRKVLYL